MGSEVAPLKVPVWDNWFESYEVVGNEQRAFYHHWAREFDSRRPLPLGENVGYPFAYARQIVRRFLDDGDIGAVSEAFARLDAAYAHTGAVGTMICDWWSDCYLVREDYREAWAVRRRLAFRSGLSLARAIWFRGHLQPLDLDGHSLIAILSNDIPVTRIGKRYLDDVLRMADLFLDGYIQMRGTDILGELLEIGRREAAKAPRTISRPSCEEKAPMFWEHVPGWHHILLPRLHPCLELVVTAGLAQILRECENAAREGLGLPQIGEGWASEVELLHAIRDRFPSERILPHGRPAWLGQQHLDVYFPDANVAVEYQGIQHFSAVGFFGGEVGLKAGLKRDARKKMLCEQHGCRLLLFTPGTDPESFLNELAAILSREA